ncbi:MAG: STN domain-containing protein [Rudaea sp.]|uniref:STN domain-containing protein n=1 Tax=Rudaea sp. TaxID=2136325 RepID=UPI0039E21E10
MGKAVWTAVVCTILLLCGATALPDIAAAQAGAQAQPFNIPAGDLNGALRAFSEQSHVQLIYPTELADGKKSKGLSGSYTSAEALRRLLSGSGLESETVNDKTVVLKKSESPTPVKSAAPAKPSESTSQQEAPAKLEDVVVTGTHTLRAPYTCRFSA